VHDFVVAVLSGLAANAIWHLFVWALKYGK
jgi:uncharacterized membrane protein